MQFITIFYLHITLQSYKEILQRTVQGPWEVKGTCLMNWKGQTKEEWPLRWGARVLSGPVAYEEEGS